MIHKICNLIFSMLALILTIIGFAAPNAACVWIGVAISGIVLMSTGLEIVCSAIEEKQEKIINELKKYKK